MLRTILARLPSPDDQTGKDSYSRAHYAADESGDGRWDEYTTDR
jgi:hypothetical protein